MKIKDYLIQFAVGAMCVVLAAVLIAVFFMNHVRNAERAEQVQQRSAELKKQEALKKEKAIDLFEELASDLSVRRIICWGDNEMAGNGEFSLPKALRDVSNEKLFTGVSEAYTEITNKETENALTVTVNNMGVRNEGMREILVRSGVNDLYVGEWMVIPSDTEPHNIVLKDGISWQPLQFAEQSEVRFGKVRIGEIEGTLTTGEGEYDEDHPRFAFVRDEEGDSISVGSKTQIEIASASRYVGDIPVFFFEDDSADSVDSFVEALEGLVERYTEYDDESEEEDDRSDENAQAGSTLTETASAEEPDEDSADSGNAQEDETPDERRYVVICTADEDSELDDALREAFGEHYIRSNTYASDMTEDSYKELAQKVYDKLDSQGCFNAVKKQTEEVVRQLEDL